MTDATARHVYADAAHRAGVKMTAEDARRVARYFAALLRQERRERRAREERTR